METQTVGTESDDHRTAIMDKAISYGPVMLRLVKGILRGNEHDAEDVVQEIYCNLWEKALSDYEERGELKPWLLRSARNAAISKLRSKKAKFRKATYIGSLEDDNLLVDRTSAGALDSMIRQEEREVARAYLERLDPKYSHVLREHYFKDKEAKEIAEESGIPKRTVNFRLDRGRQLVRQMAS